MKSLLIAAALALAVTGCTDTQAAHWGALGQGGRATCFSGGKVIADDYSTGKIGNASNSDGYEFKSATTRRLEQFSGDCVVDYGIARPADFVVVLPGKSA
jgi:hypothetical protein